MSLVMRHILELRQHQQLQLLRGRAEFDIEHIGVEQQGVGNHVVAELGRFIERWRADVGPRRLEQLAVEDQVALDFHDALVAQGLQHVLEHVGIEIRIGAAAQDQIAFQYAIDDVGAGAQLRAAAKGGAQLLQADGRGHQFHGRRRLHAALGAMRHHDGIAAQDDGAHGVLGNIGAAQQHADRFRQLRVRRRQAKASDQRGDQDRT